MFSHVRDWVASSLSRKYAAGNAAGLLAVSMVFLFLFIGMYSTQLKKERGQAALRVNNLLQTSLEAAMLRRDLGMLRSIIDQLGKQKDITSVDIINRKGDIRFSSQTAHIDLSRDLQYQKHSVNPATSTKEFTYFTKDDKGNDILRTIHPVLNRDACKECHGLSSVNPVNGTLIVDYEASSIEQHARTTTLFLMGSGSLVVLITLFGGWWFMQRFVLEPLGHLSSTSEALAAGNLNARVQISGKDELAKLGERFNLMAESLQSNIKEIENKERFLQSLVDANPDGFRVIDENYNIVLANEAYCDSLGVDPKQTIGEKCYKSSHGKDEPCISTLVSCPLEQLKNSKLTTKTLHYHQDANNKIIAVEIFSAPIQVSSNGNTQRLLVESIRDLGKILMVSHEQKLSEIGSLAAGVAHEIRNPLASVRLALDSAIRISQQDDMSVPDKVVDSINLVDHEIDRCIEITERLLKLSMFAGESTQIVSVNNAITDTLSLISWEAMEKSIKINQHFDQCEPRIIANESDLRIIILNLTQNAIHAMPKGGTLTVNTRCTSDSIEIRFFDTGIGIEAHELQKIFHPFFSKRADSVQGTGLGLSISKALVERYKGTIEVTSKPNEGCCFTLVFPNPDKVPENNQ